jgi:hypothetical protein
VRKHTARKTLTVSAFRSKKHKVGIFTKERILMSIHQYNSAKSAPLITKSVSLVVLCLLILQNLLFALPIESATALPLPFSVSPDIVISQVYGGGGNAGATYKNDFIEIFNRGASSVSVTGWSVQYTSAGNTGTTWQVTALSGPIPAGGYYLIQEVAGAGGTTNLPAPD